MRYLDELKDLVHLHSRAQAIDRRLTAAVLAAIESAEHDGAGSWTQAWSEVGEAAWREQRWLDAVKMFNLARFPFVQREGQRRAHHACVASFAAWVHQTRQRVETLTIAGGAFKAYAAGLDHDWPMLIVTGGIVSIKEQWHRFLQLAERLRLCVVVAEMPGVGENTLCYHPSAHAMYGAILDTLVQRANTAHCHLLALSFSGHLALLHASVDQRIIGVTTVGAPVVRFFRDEAWFAQVPEVTKRTLAHLTRYTPETLFEEMRNWALPDDLPPITVPVYYLQSKWDEIIPEGEVAALGWLASDLRSYRLPDVHGSPNHLGLMSLWIVSTILATDPRQRIKAGLVKLAWRVRAAMQGAREYRHA
ncbi:alpha/beta hydrolase [Acidiferrobacter thiooxydans]|uniref:alpha/beta hydrolase n=1 Tax=Acidiferrobacter thiooxydans TaxID=163359 RepID=UPI000B092936|nr:hypothetical protein [Acidiferrobacter thiooxydans]MDA8190554.1 hypothetical protein [Gammaproteobacteria bacterium]UEN98520.1 alpha/beta hydrolase [Acidiferrobacter thiooxydans]